MSDLWGLQGQHIFYLQNVHEMGIVIFFSCQWEPEQPDGLFWQDSLLMSGWPNSLQSYRKWNVHLFYLLPGKYGKSILTWLFSLVSC